MKMLLPNKRTKSFHKQTKNCGAKRTRRLFSEQLESRLNLSGTVTTALAAGVLTITGDVSVNDVLITKTANPNEFLIQGVDTDGNTTTAINGPTLINTPFNTIHVDLKGGGDDFRIEGNSPTDRITIPATVNIFNTGQNFNRLKDVIIAGQLNVTKAAGVGLSRIEITDTEVDSSTTIVNTVAGGDGDSKTMITAGSRLEGDFTLVNGAGKDILVVDQSNMDGDATVVNGDGDTRTVFGMSEDPIISGDLVVVNGVGTDTFVLNNTDVFGTTTVVNGDGNTSTTLSTTNIGVGHSVPVTTDAFILVNGLGTDAFRMASSTIKESLDIVNIGAAGQTSGSQTQIVGSTINGNVSLVGDDGVDTVNISAKSTIGRDLTLTLGDGGNSVTLGATLADLIIGGDLTVVTGAGGDHVVMQGTTVQGNTDIVLGAGVDKLELLLGTQLQGLTTLDGGPLGPPDIDTLVEQVTPGPNQIDIAILTLDNFELHQFT
jgi:hypothetical protein